MTEERSVQSDFRRAVRIAWYGSVAVAAIGYAVLVPLKWYGLLPMKMTWSRVLLSPIFCFLTSMAPILILMTSRPQKKMFIRLGIWFLSVIVLVAVVSSFDPVPGGP